MAKAKSLEDEIKKQQHLLAKYQFVLSQFPDAKLRNSWLPDFSSKLVNSMYSGFDFEQGWSTLNVVPYYNLAFTYNGQTEIIKVHSLPRRSRLCRLSWKRSPDNKRIITFSRLAVNLKNNNFKDDMLNECRAQIMQFIQKNPGCELDTKHLEPRLKKLLLFT